MQVLIVEHNLDLATIWANFLSHQGVACAVADTAKQAYDALRSQSFDALLLDTEFPGGEAIVIADFATYRDSDLPIIPVSASGFFSDCAIFELIPNARGLIRAPARLDDMAAVVQHYGLKHHSSQRLTSGG